MTLKELLSYEKSHRVDDEYVNLLQSTENRESFERERKSRTHRAFRSKIFVTLHVLLLLLGFCTLATILYGHINKNRSSNQGFTANVKAKELCPNESITKGLKIDLHKTESVQTQYITTTITATAVNAVQTASQPNNKSETNAMNATVSRDPYLSRDFTDHIKEIKYIQYLTYGHTVNKTVILIQANIGFFELALNLDCGLRRRSAPSPIFWVQTEATNNLFRSAGLTTYYNPSLSGVDTSVNYHTKEYNLMMRQRPYLWSLFLEAGVNLFWMDADTSVVDDPFKSLHWDVDLEIQTDLGRILYGDGPGEFNATHACAGLFLLRASPQGKKITELMLKGLQNHTNWEDQEVLNYNVIDVPEISFVVDRHHIVKEGDVRNALESAEHDKKITVRYTHPLDWANGHLLNSKFIDLIDDTWYYRKNDTMIKSARIPQIIHMNGIGRLSKVETLKRLGAWYLTEDLRCSLSF